MWDFDLRIGTSTCLRADSSSCSTSKAGIGCLKVSSYPSTQSMRRELWPAVHPIAVGHPRLNSFVQ